MTSGRDALAAGLRRHGIVAILRGVAGDTLAARVQALHAAGIRVIELALSEPGALPLVAQLARVAPPDMLVGAGTVTSRALAEAAHAAGARFLVTPHVAPDVVAYAAAHDLGVLCGALTPSEVAAVHAAGGRFVKLFPASAMGPAYLRALRGPYPALEAVVVGGVGSGNLADYLAAGAVGAGVGGALARGSADDGFATAAAEAAALIHAFERHLRAAPP